MYNVYDVLCAGDLYLMPGLKRHCANSICQYLELDNIINILRTARLFDLPRLEDQCVSFMATYIDKVCTKIFFLNVFCFVYCITSRVSSAVMLNDAVYESKHVLNQELMGLLALALTSSQNISSAWGGT